MANLQYGDTLDFQRNTSNSFIIRSVEDVVPIKFDSIKEVWVVCAQKDASHMMIEVADDCHSWYMFIEIGKCDNLYLLADAIVD